MKDFNSLGLSAPLLQGLKRAGFETPTPIQEQTISLALEGKDICGTAQTGTGKTGAYVIPILAKIMESPKSCALILAPTRELASQILETVHQFLGSNPIKTALAIGGLPMFKQLEKLRKNPQIVVGTPGRVSDHLRRGTLKLTNFKFFVIDEADRMMDMGFGIQLKEIVRFLPTERQTLMFSATMPTNVVKLANQYLTNPERVSVGSTTNPVNNITQEFIRTSEAEKFTHLMTQLVQNEGSTIIFVKRKIDADKLSTRLSRESYNARAIHGDLDQRKRERVLKSFRDEEFDVLVATDVLSRGLDIQDIKLTIVNYHLPECPEDYIHRIGRTGRNGAKGLAISLVSPEDARKMDDIRKMMDPTYISPKHNGGGGNRFNKFRGGNDRNKSNNRNKPFQFKRNNGGKKTFSSPRPILAIA